MRYKTYPKIGEFFKPNPHAESKFLYSVVHWSWIALAATCTFQCIFFASITNITALISIIVAWTVATKIFLRPAMLRSHPLSAFLIIGFIATQFYFPLLFTTLEGKPVIFNLEYPYQVFFHSTAALFILLLSHTIYRALINQPLSVPSSFLNKIGVFSPPVDLQLWLMGFIGLAATTYVYLLSPNVGWEVSGSASDKAIQGLIPFSYAPYFIPFGALYGNYKTPTKRLIPFLLIFTILLFIVSIGRNSRGAFMLGFTSVGFAYALGLLLGVFQTQLFTIKNLIIGLVAFLIVTGPIADLGTAMVIIRGQRNKISNSELIDLTLQAFNDKQAIKARRLEDNLDQGDWDERYLDNIFTARFSNLKFNDASLAQANKISDQDDGMLQYSIKYVLGALPGPVLTALGVDADKDAVYGVSFGDYLYSEAGGPVEALGGFRTGHFAGTGMASFGWWYLLILGVGMFPVYWLFDKLIMVVNSRDSNPTPPASTLNIRFSLCGMLALTSIFQFLPAESVTITATFLFRHWIQMVVLYAAIFYITNLIAKLFKSPQRRLNRAR
ncbi:hypothetical protein [Hymenobacter coccineus]|uniref:hypothetical protein n=1 Tax=Hymenobacter coccineus TaxID=1908235 RepID=UPI000AE88BB6|nr:hypothetical protein [Hymenobacter coccineus]